MNRVSVKRSSAETRPTARGKLAILEAELARFREEQDRIILAKESQAEVPSWFLRHVRARTIRKHDELRLTAHHYEQEVGEIVGSFHLRSSEQVIAQLEPLIAELNVDIGLYTGEHADQLKTIREEVQGALSLLKQELSTQ